MISTPRWTFSARRSSEGAVGLVWTEASDVAKTLVRIVSSAAAPAVPVCEPQGWRHPTGSSNPEETVLLGGSQEEVEASVPGSVISS